MCPQLLSTGGVFVTGYDIATNKILLTLQRGWFGQEVKEFLLSQPEVKEVEWDSVKYRPGKKAGRPKKRSGKGGKAGKKGKAPSSDL